MKKRTKARTSKPGEQNKGRTAGIAILKGLLFSFVFTALAILAFAFLIKSFGLSDAVIGPVNVGIKMVGVLIAAMTAVKQVDGFGWLVGIGAGVGYAMFGFLLLSLLDGAFGLLPMLLGDMVMGAIVGFAASILCRMRPEKKRRKMA